jgi:(1->4)-alpha-D-glucan 1-alpha-D-glucosylmutase
MQIPGATYRLQFHKDFTFRDALAIVPYLAELGITDAYASPILKARPGSSHGYDISDHHHLNPEVGSDAEFDAWVDALKTRGMGILLDIVPNHMAVVGSENTWWNDILENGPSSPYAGYFDIAWSASTRPELQGRVLIPILGEPYIKVLESQQLKVEYESGSFSIRYFDHRFPVAPRSYGLILMHRLTELETQLGPSDPALHELESILTAVKHLPRRNETDPALVAERQREKEVIKRRLGSLTAENSAIRDFIARSVNEFNGTAGDPASFNLLEEMLDDQAYRLAFWRVAAEEINYRRFFDINELAALSMERQDVFDATHELILRLIRDGKVRGVRIDHPDGLFDPREYLGRLQQASGGDLYAIVEKILAADETLPPDWPTAGTTGYEFLNIVNGLFVDGSQEGAFTRLYRDAIGDLPSFGELVYEKKLLILEIALAGEMQMLTHQLDRIAQNNRSSRDFTRSGLGRALREVIACFPVYRSYITGPDVAEADRRHVLRAVRRAAVRNPGMSMSIFHFIRDTLLCRPPAAAGAEYLEDQRRFVGKFQQVTSPVMAKGAEDTAAYIANRLVSLNEVGGDPDRFGIAPAAFHEEMTRRQASHPHALSATATHDTKRGEDVRARIDVLSELPAEWAERRAKWSGLNERHRIHVEDFVAPDVNEEYLFYQTLLGAWPIGPVSAEAHDGFVGRVKDYMEKALHEAKVHSTWINPNHSYDEAVRQFVGAVLDPTGNAEFLADFRSFQRKIHAYGIWNSLGQTLLKIAAPGVPDIYQGTEFWELSLVDPDNRRPVDFALRGKTLAGLRERGVSTAVARELLDQRDDGRIKMYLLWRGLTLRREWATLFSDGAYQPLDVVGPAAEHVVSFARIHGDQLVIAVVPRLLVGLIAADQTPCQAGNWSGTRIALGDLPMRRFRNAFTGAEISVDASAGRRELPVELLLRDFPVSLLGSI